MTNATLPPIYVDKSAPNNPPLGGGKRTYKFITWKTKRVHTFQIEVRFVKEDEGGYSVYCATLPGAVSQGETLSEATAMIHDAARGVIRSFVKSKRQIPWRKPIASHANEVRRWILVHV